MASWFRQLDELLRGERVRGDKIAIGAIEVRPAMLIACTLALGGAYGSFMGWYAVSMHGWNGLMQLASATIKLPLLFLFTLGVTFPSLYVFNALVGCRLGFGSTLRLLLTAIVVNLAVGASLGPILGFFTLSTTSYPFMVLLNVVLLSIGGVVGLGFLLKTLRDLARAQAQALGPQPLIDVSPGGDAPPTRPAKAADLLPRRGSDGESETDLEERHRAANERARRAAAVAREQRERSGLRIFGVWVVLYAIVGAQMGWVLRPFVGAPGQPFTLLRERQGSIVTGAGGAFLRLFENPGP